MSDKGHAISAKRLARKNHLPVGQPVRRGSATADLWHHLSGVDLSLDITAAANATYVTVAGEIDLANHGELERTLQQLGADRRHVELDLRGVTFIDSSGLAMLMRMREHCAAQGGNLVLNGMSERVRRLFELVGIAALFTIVE